MNSTVVILIQIDAIMSIIQVHSHSFQYQSCPITISTPTFSGNNMIWITQEEVPSHALYDINVQVTPENSYEPEFCS